MNGNSMQAGETVYNQGSLPNQTTPCELLEMTRSKYKTHACSHIHNNLRLRILVYRNPFVAAICGRKSFLEFIGCTSIDDVNFKTSVSSVRLGLSKRTC